MFTCDQNSFCPTSNHQSPRKLSVRGAWDGRPMAKQVGHWGANDTSKSHTNFIYCGLATEATFSLWGFTSFSHNNTHLGKSGVVRILNGVSHVIPCCKFLLRLWTATYPWPPLSAAISQHSSCHTIKGKKSYYGRISLSTSSLIQPFLILKTQGNPGTWQFLTASTLHIL